MISIYEYLATITKVVDGDTVHADVDLGFDVRERMTLRLAGIDAPEMGTEAGRQAHDFLTLALERLPIVRIVTIKDRREKYGRYLATIYAGETNVNQALIDAGHAVPYEGGKR